MSRSFTLASIVKTFPPIWVTDKGEEIALTDMTTDHVANCITAIERGDIMRIRCNGYTTEEWLQIFKMELKGRKLGVVARL